MILANLCGFIFSKLDLKFFRDFMSFKPLLNASLIKKIIAMQTDWGGEYGKPNSFFHKIGISHLVSCPHAHQ
jgi:hypothetical protein